MALPSRSRIATTLDLAKAVSLGLKKRATAPDLDVLAEIFEVMFGASLRTEEGAPVRFSIAYVNPLDPDPQPPVFPPANRWSCTPFESPLDWTITNILKLATASDPRGSSLAIYQVGDRLQIWGLIDQQNAYHDFVNLNTERGPERPGEFQAQVEGLAHLRVYRDYVKVAELRIDEMVGPSLDVLHRGPIRTRLDAGIRMHVDDVNEVLSEDGIEVDSYWRASFVDKWLAALSRVLLRVQNYRHGGILLIPADSGATGLNVKFPLRYDRLRTALAKRAANVLRNTLTAEFIIEDYMDADLEEMPVALHVENEVSRDDFEGNLLELDGATRFVSLLSRVDGAVLLSPALDVIGFGVEITEQEIPRSVMSASTRTAGPRALKAIPYDRYGTRHRSVMRYCWGHPGSVGFVVSQDGDIRAVTRLNDDVVLWDDIRLRIEYEYVRETRALRRDDTKISSGQT